MALVLVVDKATRAWGEKSAAEATREWAAVRPAGVSAAARVPQPAGLRPSPRPMPRVSGTSSTWSCSLPRSAGHRPYRLAQPAFSSATDTSSSFLAALDLDDPCRASRRRLRGGARCGRFSSSRSYSSFSKSSRWCRQRANGAGSAGVEGRRLRGDLRGPAHRRREVQCLKAPARGRRAAAPPAVGNVTCSN